MPMGKVGLLFKFVQNGSPWVESLGGLRERPPNAAWGGDGQIRLPGGSNIGTGL